MIYQYIINKEFKLEDLIVEIITKGIVGIFETATLDTNLLVTYRDPISIADKLKLDEVIADHVAVYSNPDNPTSPEDNIPYTFPLTMPLGYFVCFQGAGDIEPTATDDGIGKGERLTFKLSHRDEEEVKTFTFNEDVYISGGCFTCKNERFGAGLDIDIMNPYTGEVARPFARNIPLYSESLIPVDSATRSLIPKGVPIRITVYNSGIQDGIRDRDEDSPASFSMAGRFEIYRRIT